MVVQAMKQETFTDIEYSFRHLLEAHGLNKLYFDAINRVMVQNGHRMKGSTIVDATIINAPSSTKKQLEAAGCTVDLQYAANDIATQVSQVENMIANGCEVLVIASIDAGTLVCPSGQTEKQTVATANWATDAAQARFETILGTYYTADQLAG